LALAKVALLDVTCTSKEPFHSLTALFLDLQTCFVHDAKDPDATRLDIKLYPFKVNFKAHAKGSNVGHEDCLVEEALAWFQGSGTLENWPSRDDINPKICLPEILSIKAAPSLYVPQPTSDMPPPKPRKGKPGKAKGSAASQPAMSTVPSMSLRVQGDEFS
jgi:hypothetical protein